MEGKVGNEPMASSKIYPRGSWQDTSFPWSTGPGDGQGAELQQTGKARLWEGEKRRREPGECQAPPVPRAAGTKPTPGL